MEGDAKSFPFRPEDFHEFCIAQPSCLFEVTPSLHARRRDLPKVDQLHLGRSMIISAVSVGFNDGSFSYIEGSNVSNSNCWNPRDIARLGVTPFWRTVNPRSRAYLSSRSYHTPG
jgi:hypothetical protein